MVPTKSCKVPYQFPREFSVKIVVSEGHLFVCLIDASIWQCYTELK